MLFNSFEFIFSFLPIVLFIYFALLKLKQTTLAKCFLVLGSLFFYSWWNISYLPLIVISLLTNYAIGKLLEGRKQKSILILGISMNVALLSYFKYADFFIVNMNVLLQKNMSLLHLALPLAISFFTFQQIAYLVDSYKQETKAYPFIDYALFVTFFPQLIAGPIVHHKEIRPQFDQLNHTRVHAKNIALGIFIFSIGLFKKVAIADTFAVWATNGFDHSTSLTMIEGWITSLSFTFQLYFDFSGYTDMAIGVALLFNIILPINFNSPYKAVNIQDFWQRWHMTLTRFLMKYIYIPLGGSRRGTTRLYLNILLVFLISGLWHGAGWTFIFWGFSHGLASVIHRYWRTLEMPLPPVVGWLITFLFVNTSWVFFRATTWADAHKVLRAMFGFTNGTGLHFFSILTVPVLIIGIWIVLFRKNSIEMMNGFTPSIRSAVFISIILIYAVTQLHKVSEFLYFNF